MSERSKGDVSRVNNNPNAPRVVKNPLLSASVTGLSYEDFPNKPQLLPAAPPVVHAPPPASTPVLIAGILNREPKTLVTVGQPSSIDDSEALDEINLNTSSEDSSGVSGGSSTGYLRGTGDGNANPLLEPPPGAGNDSLLSQAASSFTALPSVASNVFSTFSKRIYAGTKESEEPKLDIQPTYIHQAGHYAPPPVAAAPPPPFYAAPPAAANELVAAPEPPKFYAPTEVPAPNVGIASAPPPTASGNPNTYRFTARKKLYAPIPGFTEQSAQGPQIPQAPQAGLPFQTPPYPAQQAAPFEISSASPFEIQGAPPAAAATATEERKSGGGLFSLSNLVPTGVLQNISGLVQSATGRSSEQSVSNPPPSGGGYFDINTVAPANPSNYFGGPTAATPPAGSYFVPAAVPEAATTIPQPPVGGFFPQPANPIATAAAPTSVAAPPTVGGFFGAIPPANPAATDINPISGAPPVGGFFTPGVAAGPPTVGGFYTPVSAPIVEAPPPAAAAIPPTSALSGGFTATPGAVPSVTTSTTAAPPPIGGFFDPSPAASGIPPTSTVGGFFTPAAVPPVATAAPVPPVATVAAAAPPPVGGFFAPAGGGPPSNATPLAGPPLGTAPPLAGPPLGSTTVAGPPPAAGQASYRLQKGTRLYKSPLTAQETATASAFGTPFATTAAAPAAVFNPFGTGALGVFNPLAGNPPVGQQQSEDNSAVALFAPPSAPVAGQTIDQGPAPPAAFASTNQGSPFPAPQPGPQATPFFIPQTGDRPPVPTSQETAPSSQGISFFEAPPSSDIALFTPPPVQETAAAPIETQGISFFAPQPDLAPSAAQEIPLFVPAAVEAPPEGHPLYPPTSTAVAEDIPAAESPLFVPVPTSAADQSQGVPLYPPETATSNASSSVLFAASEHQPSAPLFEAVQPPSTEAVDASASDFFGSAKAEAVPASANTETAYSPFGQTVTTPSQVLPTPPAQDLLPPPIGFVAPQQPEAEPEPEPEVAAAAPPAEFGGVTEALALAHPPLAPSPLQSFFSQPATAAPEDFNFFAAPGSSLFPELPQQRGIAPPPLAQEPPPAAAESGIAPGLGFDQFLSQSQQAQSHNYIENSNENSYQQNSSVNSFSGYFGGPTVTEAPAPPPATTTEAAVPLAAPVSNCDPSHFFDQVPQPQAPTNANEDQRIQNFFNNPPLQDQPAAPGELKYDIVHSGLPVKQLQARSQTPISNLVEPPSSSACSEFSTLAQAAPTASATAPATNPTVERQTGEDLLQLHQAELPEEILKELRMATNATTSDKAGTPPVSIVYTPAVVHWFYKRRVDAKHIWTPFSHYDSALLETSLHNEDSTLIVPVEGGRYDVSIKERTKTPVYWEGKGIEVRRCSWFYKGVDSKYVPYSEDTAALLEDEYKRSAETGEWHQKIMLANGEQVVFHGPTVIVHFLPQQNSDSWGASAQSSMRPRVVKRDLDDFVIKQGESQRVDHLLFMVHGIGSACDLKMRSVEEVVDDFRDIAQQLVQSHYKNSTDMGLVGRVEVLPISWHGHLHSEEEGIDEKLKSITLESIPRLRNFTNDTLLDVLFYTSPKYCQKIMNTVADALNEVYLKYRFRHPEFNGGVSLAGHSLGSLILFDLLCHQEPLKESEEENKENPDQLPQKNENNYKKVQLPSGDLLPKQVSYTMGPAGTGQPVINYTQLIFHPKKFFALGSPIGMFVTIRGIDQLGLDFHLPTCPGFYNIFHPFDPVAYRIEALVNADMNGIRPVLIPHHKGRKRMHLELRETMTRVGADIKQRFMDTFKTTLDSVNFLATVTKVKKEAEETLEKQVLNQTSSQFQKENDDQEDISVASTSTKTRNRTYSNSTTASDPEFVELDFPLGKLNDSKRVDYVLQEAPLEFINEYIFALSSHVCYWGSEDTILFVMKEIYASLGISTDSQVPQQSMTIERPGSFDSSQSLLPM
ncbi:proline-rich protein 36 isoform X1 [Drosophila pseudoobscura]|uniref:Proline-rich protein 36 isoform X1 n=1 Tax=Drosophila pseudoobscura pseudoobscura TaxID=46245 RepID=A0A6I8UJH7_DROPS|nr:proline-rich protein 36 isoform X1 [Drosophila pseudoobscura]